MPTFIESLTTLTFNEAALIVTSSPRRVWVDLGAFFSSFIGTKECAVPNPTRGQGLGISWTQDKEKCCFPAEGTFREEVTGTSRPPHSNDSTSSLGAHPRRGRASPSILPFNLLELHCVRGETGARKASQGRHHLFLWPKPTSVRNALNKQSAASRRPVQLE